MPEGKYNQPVMLLIMLLIAFLPMIGVPQFAAIEPKYIQIIHIVILLLVSSLCLRGKHTQTKSKR